jgi:hypothetical protein
MTSANVLSDNLFGRTEENREKSNGGQRHALDSSQYIHK